MNRSFVLGVIVAVVGTWAYCKWVGPLPWCGAKKSS